MHPPRKQHRSLTDTPGHGPIRLLRHRCCVTPDCLRPASELGGLCSPCWRGARPEQRAVLRWEAELMVANDFDAVAAAEAILRRAA